MTDLRKAAEMALKLLENKRLRTDEHIIPIVADELRQALAQPEREWVGLTDEEIDYIFGLAYADDMELLRTIEAKLKDKNG